MTLDLLIEALGELTLSGVDDLCFELDAKREIYSREEIDLLVEDGLWGINLSPSLGYSLCSGYMKILGSYPFSVSIDYSTFVRESEKHGLDLCHLMSLVLPFALRSPDPHLMPLFRRTVNAMISTGVYTLFSPLRCLITLFETEKHDYLNDYLRILETAFIQNLSYNAARVLSHDIPRETLKLVALDRLFLMHQWSLVMETDYRLSECFITGLKRGLIKLSESEISKFIEIAILKYKKKKRLGELFLSLESDLGKKLCEELSRSVSFDDVESRLNQYLILRMDFPIHVRSASLLKERYRMESGNVPSVCSDGRWIYLPEKIDRHGSRKENRDLFLFLAKMEACFYEFGSYEFDYGGLAFLGISHKIFQKKDEDSVSETKTSYHASPLSRFRELFQNPSLSDDLLLVFECFRIRQRLKRSYKGLFKSYNAYSMREYENLKNRNRRHPLFPFYSVLALGINDQADEGYSHGLLKLYGKMAKMAILNLSDPYLSTINESVRLTSFFYFQLKDCIEKDDSHLLDNYETLFPLYNIRLRPELYETGIRQIAYSASLVQDKLKQKGISMNRADIKKWLIENKDGYSSDRFLFMLDRKYDFYDPEALSEDIGSILKKISGDENNIKSPMSRETFSHGYRYWEWDCYTRGYLSDHVIVDEKNVSSESSSFYAETLDRNGPLIRKIRHMLERLKPHGTLRMRRWTDGDELDYGMLVEYMVEKKTEGRPSDRFYIKRIKKIRDIATLFLIDLSRSTESAVIGGSLRILDIEKEAAVILSEALHAVGDQFAVYGYSGSGRQSVCFYRIKAFEESYSSLVKNRIGNICSVSNTRMGAAIRHATFVFSKIRARSKVMILLGDGFPNDLDYKLGYAIEDTHRAILEARFEKIVTKAITVNMGADPKLDALYGPYHHMVISNIAELPDRLLTLYSRLTADSETAR